MSKLLGSLRPAAGAKLPQASSISSVHSPIEFGLSFTFYPTKSNPIESKAIGYPYSIRSKSIRIQVKKSNWIWIKPNPLPGLVVVIGIYSGQGRSVGGKKPGLRLAPVGCWRAGGVGVGGRPMCLSCFCVLLCRPPCGKKVFFCMWQADPISGGIIFFS